MFWGMTPRLFMGLVERWKEEQARRDRRAGEVVAMIYNMNRDPKADPKGWDWMNVFPEHRPPKPVQTDEEMFHAMELWATATEMVS